MENVIYSDYMVPRKIQEDIEEAFGKENAPVLIRALEHGLNQVQKKNEEQRIVLKSEIKEEITKDLVTREVFYSENKRLEEKIDRNFMFLKIILYVMFAGFVLFNPTVANLIATVFSVAK